MVRLARGRSPVALSSASSAASSLSPPARRRALRPSKGRKDRGGSAKKKQSNGEADDGAGSRRQAKSPASRPARLSSKACMQDRRPVAAAVTATERPRTPQPASPLFQDVGVYISPSFHAKRRRGLLGRHARKQGRKRAHVVDSVAVTTTPTKAGGRVGTADAPSLSDGQQERTLAETRARSGSRSESISSQSNPVTIPSPDLLHRRRPTHRTRREGPRSRKSRMQAKGATAKAAVRKKQRQAVGHGKRYLDAKKRRERARRAVERWPHRNAEQPAETARAITQRRTQRQKRTATESGIAASMGLAVPRVKRPRRDLAHPMRRRYQRRREQRDRVARARAALDADYDHLAAIIRTANALLTK